MGSAAVIDAPLHRYRASRAELADLDLAQRDLFDELEQRLSRMEADLAAQRAVIAGLSHQSGDPRTALTGNGPPVAAPRPSEMPGPKPNEPAPADRRTDAGLVAMAGEMAVALLARPARCGDRLLRRSRHGGSPRSVVWHAWPHHLGKR